MRMLYDKLRSLTEASELADKNGVLEGAIALIQVFNVYLVAILTKLF